MKNKFCRSGWEGCKVEYDHGHVGKQWDFVICGRDHRLECPTCKKITKFGNEPDAIGFSFFTCQECGETFIETKFSCKKCHQV